MVLLNIPIHNITDSSVAIPMQYMLRGIRYIHRYTIEDMQIYRYRYIYLCTFYLRKYYN